MQGLTREDLLGDMFETGILGYYAQYNALSYVAGLRQGGQHILAAGMGSFGYEPNVTYIFGVPTSIHGGGAVMNVPIQSVIGFDQDGSDAGKQARLNYVLQSGTISSALEGAVPEQMFVTSDNPGEAISAVKALAKANAAGQHIYHITKANEDQVLPLIHHSALVMQEIKDALAAGKEVITHTDSVSVPGWSGAGYIIYDPQTGSGAYKIAGGENGAYLALGLVLIGVMMLLTAFCALEAFPAIAASDPAAVPYFISYVAFLEFMLFMQAISFATSIANIANSNCSEATKEQLAEDEIFYLLVQVVTSAVAGKVGSGSRYDYVANFMREAIRFVGITGGYAVFDKVVSGRINDVLDGCNA